MGMRKNQRDVDIKVYSDVVDELLDYAKHEISTINPSDWYEKNRIMTRDVSSRTGPFRYYHTPYCREIVDCLSSECEADEIAVMMAAQIGKSSGVIEPGIGWIVSESPGPILYMVGNEENKKGSMLKVEKMLHATGLKDHIQPSVQRARRNRTGDTASEKEFFGGSLKLMTANHKALREFSVQYGFIDDFDAMKTSSKDAGDTRDLVVQRFAAYSKRQKIFYISSPELEETSNIYHVYMLGDQRRFYIPCPCCGEFITLEWDVECEADEHKRAGITWEFDEENRLNEDSVGYICQKCGSFFDESGKPDWMNEGEWKPTAKPMRPGFRSYQVSALYGSIFMRSWVSYVYQYLQACPPEEKRIEKKYQTFVNVVLGLPYKQTGEKIKATQLMENIRPYSIKTIPESLSKKDGNGSIILLTCAIDINGKIDDARLDYEIVAHSESGSTYSIDEGSVGTFINKDTGLMERELWTYQHNMPNSVWPELYKILTSKFPKDTDAKELPILLSGIDANYLKDYVWEFIDNSNLPIVAINGVGDDKPVRWDHDRKLVKPSVRKANLYLVDNNVSKDELATLMGLKFDPNYHETQPAGFMNFPQPADGKYSYKNFFKHFEAEEKVMNDKKQFVWKKTSSHLQNHKYDCRLYNNALKEIFLIKFFEGVKGMKKAAWTDYAVMFKENSE